MWNPLEEPTNIPELYASHVRMRMRHKAPSLELYGEYWRMLMGQSLPFAIELSSVGGKAFAKRMREWRLYSVPVQGLEQKIKKELYVLHTTYNETVVPYEKVDELLFSVEQFVKHPPTYERRIPTVLGYTKFKRLYGCCGLGLPSIPAIGGSTCVCQTYAELSNTVHRYMGEIPNDELVPHLRTIQDLLNTWKQEETRARLSQHIRIGKN